MEDFVNSLDLSMNIHRYQLPFNNILDLFVRMYVRTKLNDL